MLIVNLKLIINLKLIVNIILIVYLKRKRRRDVSELYLIVTMVVTHKANRLSRTARKQMAYYSKMARITRGEIFTYYIVFAFAVYGSLDGPVSAFTT